MTTHFENLEYLKCNTSRLDLLRFQLKRLDGELIRFETNEKNHDEFSHTKPEIKKHALYLGTTE